MLRNIIRASSLFNKNSNILGIVNLSYKLSTIVSNQIIKLVPSQNDKLVQKIFYSVKKSKGTAKGSKPKVELRKEEIETVINYNELVKSMNDAIDHLKQDYDNNLNLRISPIKTPSGTIKLGEVAQVEVKSGQMYLIDLIRTPDYVKPVFEAIVKSKLHLNPQLDKTTIFLPIAKVTREHREQVSKTAKSKCEQAIKKIREAESKAMRRAKDAKNVSTDLIFNVNQHVRFLYEKYTKQANDIKDAKVKEILQSN